MTSGQEPIPGASGSQEEVSHQNPTITESSEIKDISGEDAAKASAERSQVCKEILPKIAPFGFIFQADNQENTQLVVLPEPVGTNDSPRYVAVTEKGAKIVDFGGGIDFISPLSLSMLDMSKSVYRGTGPADLIMFTNDGSGNELRREMFIVRDATQEEAMQALQRSIARRTAVNPVPASPDRYEQDEYGVSHYKPPSREASERSFWEVSRAIDQITRLRTGYAKDPIPAVPQLDFQGAIDAERAKIETPNTVIRNREVARITTAKAMAALTEITNEASTQESTPSTPV